MLTGKRPNQIVAPFKVYGFPYQDTLIDAAKSVGYKTKSYHGNSGFFFERRNAFVSMGIDEIVFREELIDRGLQPYGEWILDADLMRQIGLDANENDDKELYFVITVTSHGPFSFLPDKERHNIVQNASSLREKYLNSIHYVDRVMGDFFSAIPDDSRIVIYGDHESGTVALHVDDVLGGRLIAVELLREVPPLLGHASEARMALGALDGRLLEVLDAARLLPAEPGVSP
jgi:phosphoglycerol transferase MdoB-like AlkP superfamily enzyme